MRQRDLILCLCVWLNITLCFAVLILKVLFKVTCTQLCVIHNKMFVIMQNTFGPTLKRNIAITDDAFTGERTIKINYVEDIV